MTQTISTNNAAMNYLLGRLADSEQESIEQNFFESSTAFDDLRVAENELLDAYVGGRLGADDRKLFEERLLLTRRQQERARFASMLHEYVSKQAGAVIDEPGAGVGWLSALMGMLAMRPMALGAAAAVLLAVAATWWIIQPPREDNMVAHQNDRFIVPATPADVSPAAPLPDKGASDATITPPSANTVRSSDKDTASIRHTAAPRPLIATITLPFGSTRDATAGRSFALRRNATLVKIEATLENENVAGRYFTVVETPDGQQVWRGNASISGRAAVSTTIPRRKLPDGDYILTLKRLAAGGTYETVGDYTFRINNRK